MALTGTLVFAVLSAAISSFLFGYNIAVISNPQRVVGEWIRDVKCSRNNGKIGEGSDLWCKDVNGTRTEDVFKENPELTTLWSLIASMFPLGALVGALASTYLVGKFGRRGALIINTTTAVLGSTCMFIPYFVSSYELLIIGRVIIGLNAGVNSGVPPMYLTEISPPELRGAIGTVHQLVIVVGVFISQVLGLPYILGNAWGWPYLFAFSLVPAIIQLITLPMCPESPRHLYLIDNKVEAARKSLEFFQRSPDVAGEMSAMEEEYEAIKGVPKVSMIDLFRDRFLRRIIIVCIMVMLSQQFSGINAVMFYSTAIFNSAGLEGVDAMYATIGMGGIFVIATIISMGIVEKAGRKMLLLVGLGGMLVMTVVLVVFMKLMHTGLAWAQYGSVAAVMLFIIMFALGPGPIPWFIASELFTQGPRAPAMSIVAGVNWLSTLLITLTFPLIANAAGEYTFLVFTGFLVGFVVYTYFKVPETKGKRIDEIQAEMRQRL